MVVSNLHLNGRAGRSVGIVLFASDETERGEWLPSPPFGEGERERVSYRRATCKGVEGTEFECCETIEGRWARVCVPASSRLLAMFGTCTGTGTPFGVIVGVLGCTLRCDSLCPSAIVFGAVADFVGGFLDTMRAESRWGGGLREWGDTMTAGVCEAGGCSSSMRESCRNGCSSRYGAGCGEWEGECSSGLKGGVHEVRPAGGGATRTGRCFVWRAAEGMGEGCCV